MTDDAIVSIIKRIVFDHINPADYKAFIFGSRALGTARPYSDVDVGITGEKELGGVHMAEIQEALEESDLPYRVDVVDFSRVSDQFKQMALQKIIPLN